MKKLWLPLAAMWFSIPIIASAHVKWFVNSEAAHSPIVKPEWFSITHPAVLIWLGVTALTVIAFWFLDKKFKTPTTILNFVAKHKNAITNVAQAVLGIFLISSSLLPNTIVASPPEFAISETFGIALQYIQIAVGAMLLFNYKAKFAAVALATITFLLLATHGFVTFTENIIILSLAIYFFLHHSSQESKFGKYKAYAMEIVRIGAGISLLVSAFTEKLFDPTLGLAFLETYHWNFMHGWLPWFNNNIFVLSAGFSELIFGIVLILGLLTRLGTVMLSVFFALSAATMLIQFGVWEAHSAVYSAIILLFAFGYGQTRFWEKSKEKFN